MNKAFNIFDRLVKTLIVLLVVIMTIVELVQIFSRFVLHAPISWAEESVRYMFIWATYMTVGIGIDRNSHAAFDLLLSRIPEKGKNAYKTFLLLIAIVFFAMLTFHGIRSAAANYNQLSAALRLPFSYVIMGVPVGSVVTIIYAIKNIVQLWTENPDETDLKEVDAV